MKIYYETHSKDRIGNRKFYMHVTEDYKTKSALKKHLRIFGQVSSWMYTEEQILEKYGKEKLEKIKENAIPW